ncbi:putative inorganic phosphate cotransporter isoform X1 [Penaeus indicus]|uniref:putative inorganic phosphate cotransporter isoform X1 n=1 Tax=Penaeus indicus TaxID=29960 RepID=UPI00300D877C
MVLTGSSVLNILQHTDEDPAAGEGGPQAKDTDDSGSRKMSGSSSQALGGRARECWAARYTFALMAFLGLAVEYSLRVNLSIAIVAMAGTSEVNATTNASQDVCPLWNDTDSGGKITEGEFDWGEKTQGLVLGAFYYGYTLTNLLGGRAAEHFGGRLVFGLGATTSSFISLLSPLCARASTGLFIASRILMGLSQGVTMPALNSLMATWYPPEERAKFGPLIYGGMQFGTIVCLPVSGWLSASGFLGGWPSVFYVFGALGLLWGVPWFLLVHNRPENHPRISEAELKFITGHRNTVKKAEIVAIPWRAIITSGPVWACMIMAWGGCFGFYALLTELPTYLANIQHFDMNNSGVLSALPYVCLWAIALIWGALMDGLYAAGHLSIRGIRRLSTAFASYMPAAALVVMCFVNCNSSLAIVVLCVAVGCTGSSYSGSLLMEQDIAPNLAGTLVGITNTVGSITGFIAPAVVGAITAEKQGSLSAWRTVFVVATLTYVVTVTLYLFLMSSDVQPWNEPEEVKKEVKEEGRF